MLGCRRDEHSANFLSAGFLGSSKQSSALDQILEHLHPTPKAAQLTSPCCSFISGSVAQQNLLRASHQIYSVVPSALFLVHIWPCEKNQWRK